MEIECMILTQGKSAHTFFCNLKQQYNSIP